MDNVTNVLTVLCGDDRLLYPRCLGHNSVDISGALDRNKISFLRDDVADVAVAAVAATAAVVLHKYGVGLTEEWIWNLKKSKENCKI